jgi:hypothetical protein
MCAGFIILVSQRMLTTGFFESGSFRWNAGPFNFFFYLILYANSN